MLIIASVLWLGGSCIRAIIGGELLKPGSLEFNEYLAPEAERELFRLLSITSIVVTTSYCLVLISSMVFLLSSPWKLKEHGWLMMSALLLYLFVPVEIYVMVIDAKMVYLEFFTVEGNAAFRELFLARAGALAGAPFVALLCYATIAGLAVFQPLKRTIR